MADIIIRHEYILEKKIIYFMTVVEEGSFSAAAKKFLMSQSGMSQQVTILLNSTLFDVNIITLFNSKNKDILQSI